MNASWSRFSLSMRLEAVFSRNMEGVLTILGAGGDLMCGKLLPALWRLHRQGLRIQVIGIDRFEDGGDALDSLVARSVARGALPRAAAESIDFRRQFEFLAGDLREENIYREMAKHLSGRDRCFYCAVPSTLFGKIVRNLTREGLHREGKGEQARIVFEKPFGESQDSALQLFNSLQSFAPHQRAFAEHYMAKGVPRALINFRQQKANALLEGLLNAGHVTRVDVFSDESGGVGTRGPFFDQCGTLRDMGQHVLHLLALATMDLPATAHDTGRQKKNLLDRVKLSRIKSVRGQYEGYHEESGVAAASATETFFAARLFVDNARWQDVPMVARSGKSLPQKAAGITYHFDGKDGIDLCEIRIQPEERMTFRITEGADASLVSRYLEIESSFNRSFEVQSPEAYEAILRMSMGESLDLFVEEGEILASWRILDAVREAWMNVPGLHPLHRYAVGTAVSEISDL